DAERFGFSITVDCSKANPNPGSTAKMTFGSVFFGNSKGTLNNDMSINNPSDGVNIVQEVVKQSIHMERARIICLLADLVQDLQ
ncbi:hypothetical protein ACT4UM_19480, partial [Bacillus sp. SS-TM]